MLKFNPKFRWFFDVNYLDYYNPNTNQIECIKYDNIGEICTNIEESKIDNETEKLKVVRKLIEVGLCFYEN